MAKPAFQMRVYSFGTHLTATNPYTGKAMKWDADDYWWDCDCYADHSDHSDEREAEYEDEYGNDRRDYGMGWYDCNTDWQTWR